MRLGCDHAFALRPNQARQFEQLDVAIKEALEGTPIRFHSQITDIRFDMAKDFMTCEKIYFTDTNHYSPDGEARFGKRLNLPVLLGESSHE